MQLFDKSTVSGAAQTDWGNLSTICPAQTKKNRTKKVWQAKREMLNANSIIFVKCS
jgi:hypothetical protein